MNCTGFFFAQSTEFICFSREKSNPLSHDLLGDSNSDKLQLGGENLKTVLRKLFYVYKHTL